jgi:hypothetical protein
VTAARDAVANYARFFEGSARPLRRAQHVGHRHSITGSPLAFTPRVSRHPKRELIIVKLSSVGGESVPQSTHTFCR